MSAEKRWILPSPIQIPIEFQDAIGGHPLVAEALFNRGFQDIEFAQAFLKPERYQPCSPDELPDSQAAYALLSNAIKKQQRILIWGDFDVDGQTATTVLVQGLRELGGKVIYHIPIRAKESHGINHEVLKTFFDKGFDFLITCDTGTSEHENVQYARQTGVPVIITDHHSLGKTLPSANAVVNPQRLSSDHPLRTLPGVGVAYKLIEGLFRHMQIEFHPEHFLDLVALGIVADVADQQGDIRYLLQKGLIHLRTTERIGLKNLFKNADLNPLNINEDHIGFQIAPRLNAVGRLGDANPIVEFLTTEDSGRARVLAVQIEGMNTRRRFETRQVEIAALSQLEASLDDRHAPAIVLHHPDWPGGVVGIVASRLVERYQKPVILLTGEDPVHGSARSIKGINIAEAITSQANLLNSFGGHPMAAGLSCRAENLHAFKRGFLRNISERMDGMVTPTEIEINRIIKMDEISEDFVRQIERLAPYGSGNPRLKFLFEDLKILSTSKVGKQGEHRQVIACDADENQQKFIWWNGGEDPIPEAEFDLISSLSLSDYRGASQVNAVWVDYRLSEQGQQTISREHYEITDHRNVSDPLRTLQLILEENSDTVVWAEVNQPESVTTLRRYELRPAENLVIWTTPPSTEVLNAVLQKTTPRFVMVFGKDPILHTPNAFLERLIGLVKHIVKHKTGQVSLEELASACASEEETVRVGLRLLAAMGKLEIEAQVNLISLDIVNKAQDPKAMDISKSILQKLLSESQAYRKYFNFGEIKDYFPGSFKE